MAAVWRICYRRLSLSRLTSPQAQTQCILAASSPPLRFHNCNVVVHHGTSHVRQHKCYSSYTSERPTGFFKNIWNTITLKNRLKVSKSRIIVNSNVTYMCMDEFVDQEIFMKQFDMPDTFYSWFLVTELHIWMLLVRLKELGGDESNFYRHHLVKSLWVDLDHRCKTVEGARSSIRKEAMTVFGEHLGAAMFSYDEGILGSDQDLSAAVWRTLFEGKYKDPQKLEQAVEYIRRQVKHLDEQDSNILMKYGLVTFLPLEGSRSEEDCNEKIKKIIGKYPSQIRR